jgi:hypothetical protein
MRPVQDGDSHVRPGGGLPLLQRCCQPHLSADHLTGSPHRFFTVKGTLPGDGSHFSTLSVLFQSFYLTQGRCFFLFIRCSFKYLQPAVLSFLSIIYEIVSSLLIKQKRINENKFSTKEKNSLFCFDATVPQKV